jgi:hypothetical protein
MRTLLFALSFIMFFSGAAFARDTYAHGHVNRGGTYMEPQHRTSPNSPRNDAYSTRGNANTGQQGKKSPDPYDKRYDNRFNRPPF